MAATVQGRFDDAAMFDAIATVIDAKAKPLTGDDDRLAGQRQAEALADVSVTSSTTPRLTWSRRPVVTGPMSTC